MLIRILIILLLLGGKLTPALAQTFIRVGSEQDVQTPAKPGLLLAGGATDNNDAMRWLMEKAEGGDVVVIRADQSAGYNNYLYSSLGIPVNSVTTIVISNAAAANQQSVYDAMIRAEVLFIAGGNQWNYVSHWKNTLVQDAIHYLVNEKRVAIGGTSAGLAILGEVVFTAQNNTVWSSEALENPYHFRVTLDRDFLKLPFLGEVVTDSHYNRKEGDNNDRKGRHAVFMARMAKDWGMNARGIGVNEYTAVGIEQDGTARVFGNPAYDDAAYFIQSRGSTPEQCISGAPLTWDRSAEALHVYRVPGNPLGSNTFNLNNWETGSGGSWHYWWVNNGTLHEKPMTETATLVFRTLHAIHESPLAGARVELQGAGQRISDQDGYARFEQITAGQALSYSVNLNGYFSETGNVIPSEGNMLQTVFLYPDPTNTKEVSREQSIEIYPNPASDFVRIGLDSHYLPGTILIYDSAGRQMYARHFDKTSGIQPANIHIGQWQAGTYLVMVHLPGGRKTGIFVKQ